MSNKQELAADAASCRRVAAALEQKRPWCDSLRQRGTLEFNIAWNLEAAERLEKLAAEVK